MNYKKYMFGHSDNQIYISKVYLVFTQSYLKHFRALKVKKGCLVMSMRDFWTKPKGGS